MNIFFDPLYWCLDAGFSPQLSRPTVVSFICKVYNSLCHQWHFHQCEYCCCTWTCTGNYSIWVFWGFDMNVFCFSCMISLPLSSSAVIVDYREAAAQSGDTGVLKCFRNQRPAVNWTPVCGHWLLWLKECWEEKYARGKEVLKCVHIQTDDSDWVVLVSSCKCSGISQKVLSEVARQAWSLRKIWIIDWICKTCRK